MIQTGRRASEVDRPHLPHADLKEKQSGNLILWKGLKYCAMIE